MARIYSWTDVKLSVSCIDYLNRMGIKVNGAGRCKAVWRGGTHDSVHVEPSKWFDFVANKGGSVIDLCAAVEFNGDTVQAVQRLGDMFSLTPVRVTKARPKKTRAQILTEKGYTNTATYDYTDETGAVIYSVARYEKPVYEEGEKKEFVQRTPQHEGLDPDTPKMLYNLPAVVNASRVFVVEGEKDVETLRGMGLVGTTNSGGASTWDPGLNKWLAGREIVILPDNDEAGAKHAETVATMLQPLAKSVRVIKLSALPKGDVTDWVEKEGGTRQQLIDKVDAAPFAEVKDTPEIAIARQANAAPFRNYERVGEGKSEHMVALPLRTLVKECHARFLGFPKRLGETLFDWDRDRAAVLFLTNVEAVFSWMGLVSGHNVDFAKGSGYVTKGELVEALRQRAAQYSSLSGVPHYPVRSDVFYTYGKLPPPDITHSTFWRLVSFFNPANDAHRSLLAAFLCAPLYFDPSADRPIWIIDTEDQQASGKTSLVKLCALLYAGEYISVDIGQLDREIQAIRRRLVSADARAKRIVVFDNITRTLNSPNLASLVTERFITGLAPYGRSEETRPNDLTYVVTVNNASLGDDIASRAYTVRIRKPQNPSPTWYRDVAGFIEHNRMQIFSDIIHMMDHNQLAASTVRRSRFGLFDARVLSATCRSEAEYIAADTALREGANVANMDADHGAEFLEMFLDAMRECTDPMLAMRIQNRTASEIELKSIVNPAKPIFLKSADLDWMLAKSDGELRKWTSRQIVGLIRNGHVRGFDPSVQRINKSGDCFNGDRYAMWRGVLFRPDGAEGHIEAQLLKRTGSNFAVCALVPFNVAQIDNGMTDGADGQGGAWAAQITATRTETQTVTIAAAGATGNARDFARVNPFAAPVAQPAPAPSDDGYPPDMLPY